MITTPPLAIVAAIYFSADIHIALAVEALNSVRSTAPLKRYAMVNHARGDRVEQDWLAKNFNQVISQPKNNLAAAWNRGIAHAFSQGARFVIVMNLDLQLHTQAVENLIIFAQQNPGAAIWSGTRWPELETLESAPLQRNTFTTVDYGFFMVGPDFLQRTGGFDETFEPAYLEDCDMNYRMRLAGLASLRTDSSLYWHLELGTFKGDRAGSNVLAAKMEEILRINNERYQKKWGGPPGGETFREPYNQRR